jgi:hypothetical protein
MGVFGAFFARFALKNAPKTTWSEREMALFVNDLGKKGPG